MTKKLTNIQKSYKNLLVIIEQFFNQRKSLLIPLLFPENHSITESEEKENLFNSFFANQCFLIISTSELPANLTFYTDNQLSIISFSQVDIGKIIQNVNPNKARGDNIRICMLQICSSIIYRLFTLKLIFKEALRTGLFLSEWKKENIVAIHKKGDKNF